MQCPCCKCEMQKGKLRSKGGVFFLPDGEKIPKLYTEGQMKKHNAVFLPPHPLDLFPEYPVAYFCSSCSKIIVDCG